MLKLCDFFKTMLASLISFMELVCLSLRIKEIIPVVLFMCPESKYGNENKGEGKKKIKSEQRA